jgi:hypothetical protein
MRTVTHYCCDYCNYEYSTEEEARECEDAHTFEATDPNGSKPKYHTGDFVYELAGGRRRYFRLSVHLESYWDTKKKCWIYRPNGAHDSIPETKLGLAMKASEYNRRVQDIEDKLGADYFVYVYPRNDRVGFSVDLVLKGEQK